MCGTMKQYIACKIHHHVHHTSNLFFPQTHIGLQAYPTLFPFFQHQWQGHPPLEVILMQLAPHLLMHAIVQWFPCHCLQVFILGKFNFRHTCYWNSHKSNFDGRIRSKIYLLLEYSHQPNFDGRIRCSSSVELDPRQICY